MSFFLDFHFPILLADSHLRFLFLRLLRRFCARALCRGAAAG
jgi:hypothetical protein